jgi:hypothetical protein
VRVTTRIVWDCDFNVLEHEWYEYSGQVAENKGENKSGMAASQKQMDEQNRIAREQLQQQKKFSDPTFAAMVHFLTDEHGFSPEQASEMTSQFLDQQAQRFGEASRNASTNLRRRGSGEGDNPVGGDYTRGIAALQGMQAASTSAGLRDIKLEDLKQGLANKFNTASMFLGIAPSFGNQAVGFGQNATTALGDYVKASTPQPSPWLGVLGSALGAAGTAFTGAGTKAICYIAAKLYGGWFTPKTMKARKWLGEWSERSLIGKVVVYLYARYGESLAQSPRFVAVVKPLFDRIS